MLKNKQKINIIGMKLINKLIREVKMSKIYI